MYGCHFCPCRMWLGAAAYSQLNRGLNHLNPPAFFTSTFGRCFRSSHHGMMTAWNHQWIGTRPRLSPILTYYGSSSERNTYVYIWGPHVDRYTYTCTAAVTFFIPRARACYIIFGSKIQKEKEKENCVQLTIERASSSSQYAPLV
jgi:hypothetical protein